MSNLPADPGLRTRITEYNPNDRDYIRRAYLQMGPCQTHDLSFPQKKCKKKLRRFNDAWFSEFHVWLEYSTTKDAVFFLYCYLFKPDTRDQASGESFVGEDFSNWKKKEKLEAHVGGPNSTHNRA